MSGRPKAKERFDRAVDGLAATHGIDGLMCLTECMEAIIAVRGRDEQASAILSRVAVTQPWMMSLATTLARNLVGGAA